jgi:hypothetical protein
MTELILDQAETDAMGEPKQDAKRQYRANRASQVGRGFFQ